MPRKNEIILLAHFPGICFADDWDMGSRRHSAELFRVHVGDCGEVFRAEPTELQHHIAFRGGTVAEDRPAVGTERSDQARQILTVAKNTVFEITKGLWRVDAHPIFLLEKPVDDGV